MEEDDEDDTEPAVYNGHSKRPGEISTRDVNLRNILSSRASKVKRRPPPKRLDPQELRKIEEKAQMLLVTPQLIQEFVDLKYASLEDRVSQHARYNGTIQEEYDQLVSALVANLENLVRQSSERNQTLELEYCTVRFRDSPSLEKRVAQTEEMISSLRHEVFNAAIECSEAFTVNLRQMLEVEYLRPRQSARAKIDEILDSIETIQRQYAELQEKGNAVRDGFRTLRFHCTELINANPQRYWGLDVILQPHRRLQHDFEIAAHMHRRSWIERHQSRHPLMESASLIAGGMLKGAEPLFTTLRTVDIVRGKMRDNKTFRNDARKLTRRQKAIADTLRARYMNSWNGPKAVDDPFLSTDWRRLDLTAPFEILTAFSSLMYHEVWYLLGTLQGKLGRMWDHLTINELNDCADTLHQWVVEYRHRQKDFYHHYKSYKQISMIRFEIEKRLHTLDVPNDIRERGLFVAQNPLSQDQAEFRRWITRYSSTSFEAFCMKRVLYIFDMPEMWESLVSEYQAINLAKRVDLIQRFGSVRARTRRGRAKLQRQPSGRNRGTPSATRSTRNAFKKSATSLRKQESLPATQQPAARPQEASQQRMEAHHAPIAISTLQSGTRVRMGTAMQWLKRSINASSPEPKRTSKPTVEGPQSTQDQLSRASTDGRSQNTAARTATTGSRAARNSPKPRSTRFRRLPGKPWKRVRGYCTDSRVSRNATCKDHNQYLPEQTPVSCIPVIAEPTEGDPGLARTITSPNQTRPSPSELKAKKVATPHFWSHNLHRGPDGRKLIVNYCRSLATTEEVAQHFLKSKVIGFDLEWKAQASALDGIQNNLSLIQLANEERIALFQIAMFKPARNLQDLVSPSLKRVLESPEITKVGVSIKGDSTRLRKYLGVEARSIFELSHLFKLVKYGLTDPKRVNKRAVNLSEQIEEHFGLPLEKVDDVRCGDWTRALNYRQVQCE